MGYHLEASLPYPGRMQFVAEAILPSYLEALQRAIEDAIGRLPPGGPRRILARLRRRLTLPTPDSGYFTLPESPDSDSAERRR